MATQVKTKIWLGTSFLFILLLLTGGISIFYIIKIKNDAKNILKDNYATLYYCHTMQGQLSSIDSWAGKSWTIFKSALIDQEHNITEPGEYEATYKVQQLFDELAGGDTSKKVVTSINSELQTILAANMRAIEKKNNQAMHAADSALVIIITIAGIVFLISFTFLVNFPSVITGPIDKLTEAINEISNKNYKYRIHLENKDEFGQLAGAFNDMAGRLENFESSNLNKLLFEKNRAEAVINSLKDASIGIDKNDMILFANHNALDLLGMAAEDVIGKKVKEVAAGNDLFSYLTENENGIPFKVVVNNKENFFVKEVIEVEQGETKNKVIVLKNITSFKEMDVAKTNFIATISHELKTPLAASDFSLKLLEDDRVSKLSKEQKELVSNLKHDNQRMLKILSELLNLSQLESGRIQLKLASIHPKEIVENSVASVSQSAKEKNINIHYSIEENVPAIEIDGDKTTWVLNNFLTNAIKYSYEKSSIDIKVVYEGKKVIFSVTDHGPGIDADYLPRIFERYFQVPGSREKGTGLGLAISKEFIEAQGGKIRVESDIGKGSIFYFELPLTR